MRFLTFIAAAFSKFTFAVILDDAKSFTAAEKNELYDMWEGQAERGEMDPATLMVLAKALDGDMPKEFYDGKPAESKELNLAQYAYASMSDHDVDAELEFAFNKADER